MFSDLKTKTKKDIAVDYVVSNLKNVQVIVNQPYTCVVATFIPEGTIGETIVFSDSGFAKCCWPDKFDGERGIKLATWRLARGILRQMNEAGFDYWPYVEAYYEKDIQQFEVAVDNLIAEWNSAKSGFAEAVLQVINAFAKA